MTRTLRVSPDHPIGTRRSQGPFQLDRLALRNSRMRSLDEKLTGKLTDLDLADLDGTLSIRENQEPSA